MLTECENLRLMDSKKYLEKHGWREGLGLGKHNQGRKSAVKVKRKFGRSGISSEKGHMEQSTKLWSINHWESLYNRASSNVSIGNNQDLESASLNLKNKRKAEKEDDEEEKNKTAPLHWSYQGMFVRASGNEDSDEEKKEEFQEIRENDGDLEWRSQVARGMLHRRSKGKLRRLDQSSSSK